MKKQTILVTIGLFSILAVSFTFVFLNPDVRFGVLQDVGIKNNPVMLNESYNMYEFAVGIPSPYHLSIIDDDVFFNQRYTGNLFVIKNGEYQEKPVLEFSDENNRVTIIGIDGHDSFLFVHIMEENDKKELIKTEIQKYFWNGQELDFIEMINAKTIFTDRHHSGLIISGNNEIFSAFPKELAIEETNYFEYGIHGFDFDNITNNIWHSTEVNWPEMVNDPTLKQKKYESLHVVSSDLKSFHKVWDVPYYPNSLVIPETSFSNKWENSIFVGYCKGTESRGGIYEYPLNEERIEFEITNSDSDLLTVDHTKYQIAKNFICVSDMEINQNGEIFVVDHVSNGAIYKIVPKL